VDVLWTCCTGFAMVTHRPAAAKTAWRQDCSALLTSPPKKI
jgi:hypothetical protein